MASVVEACSIQEEVVVVEVVDSLVFFPHGVENSNKVKEIPLWIDFEAIKEIRQRYGILESVKMKNLRSFAKVDAHDEYWLCFCKEFLADCAKFSLKPFLVQIF